MYCEVIEIFFKHTTGWLGIVMIDEIVLSWAQEAPWPAPGSMIGPGETPWPNHPLLARGRLP